MHAAFVLFGGCSNEIIQVGNAWRAVGVESQSSQYNKNICGNYPAAGTTAQAIHQLSVANGCATNITASASTVYFSAKDRVVLYPGFNATSGSKFYAYIEPCAISLYRQAEPKMSDAERGFVANPGLSNSVPATNGNDIILAPNPVNDEVNVSFVSDDESNVTIDLNDALGNNIQHLDQLNKLSHGPHTFTYNTAQLAAGIYFISVNINGQLHNKKMVKTN